MYVINGRKKFCERNKNEEYRNEIGMNHERMDLEWMDKLNRTIGIMKWKWIEFIWIYVDGMKTEILIWPK